MTILNIAYPFAPVGRDSVGGAEQVLTMLDRALVQSGHRSIVIACAGSSVAGELVAVYVPDGLITGEVRLNVYQQYIARIHDSLAKNAIDLVHMHGADFYSYLPPPPTLTLITLHLPPRSYPHQIFQISRPNTWMHCVSLSQHRACPHGAALLAPIPNGVDCEALTCPCAKRNFAMILGRVCPEKNMHAALDAATMAGIPAFIGGRVFPYADHEAYFHSQIVPRLGVHRFLGPLTFSRNRRLLSAAQCLLSTSLAEETSSLVAMEAIACGTPVIAYPSGAIAEIVEPGRTGFLVNSVREMADAIAAASAINAHVCRTVAKLRFSSHRAISQYFSLYRRLIEPETPDAYLPDNAVNFGVLGQGGEE